MKNLDSTRIHLDIAKNRPFSEDSVKRFNDSLRGFTHGIEYIKRKWRFIKDGLKRINQNYKVFVSNREQTDKCDRYIAPRKPEE